jgi:uncharacterized protein YndB with AHSA1/START domain
VKRWWGFETSEWLVCDVDLRVGGQWRYVIRERGHEVGFHGEFREINRPHRVVCTEVYEGFPDPNGAAAALDVVTLNEVDGVTTMTVLVQHARPEHRDAHLASGMESGMQISYNRLEDLVRQSELVAVAPFCFRQVGDTSNTGEPRHAAAGSSLRRSFLRAAAPASSSPH